MASLKQWESLVEVFFKGSSRLVAISIKLPKNIAIWLFVDNKYIFENIIVLKYCSEAWVKDNLRLSSEAYSFSCGRSVWQVKHKLDVCVQLHFKTTNHTFVESLTLYQEKESGLKEEKSRLDSTRQTSTGLSHFCTVWWNCQV